MKLIKIYILRKFNCWCSCFTCLLDTGLQMVLKKLNGAQFRFGLICFLKPVAVQNITWKLIVSNVNHTHTHTHTYIYVCVCVWYFGVPVCSMGIIDRYLTVSVVWNCLAINNWSIMNQPAFFTNSVFLSSLVFCQKKLFISAYLFRYCSSVSNCNKCTRKLANYVNIKCDYLSTRVGLVTTFHSYQQCHN
jgi:hypothetical protein